MTLIITWIRESFDSLNLLIKLGVAAFVALLFYVHGKHLRSCRDGQLT